MLLQRLVDVLGEGFTPLSAQMQLQWMLLEDAVASGDSTATHLLSFLASARGSPVVALARLTKGVGAKDWRNISPGVAEMLMRDVPEAVEVYDDNSEEEEQGVVACPWTEQAEAAELEAAANISHDFVDEDPIAEQPDDDHLDEQADANEEAPQILFDRVNPVAVEEIGKRVLSKVFRTGNGNGPTVMRICGDILAWPGRGAFALRTGRRRGWSPSAKKAGVSPVTWRLPRRRRRGRRKRRSLRATSQPAPSPSRIGSGHCFARDYRGISSLTWRTATWQCCANAISQRPTRRWRHTSRTGSASSATHMRTAPWPNSSSCVFCTVGRSWPGSARTDLGSSRQSSLPSGSQQRWLPCGRLTARTKLLAKLRQRTARPVEYLQYALNTARERELIDKVVLRLGEHRNAAVLAFEHDGLFLYWPDEPEKLRGLIESALCSFRYTVKPTMPLREALQAAARVMRSGSPGLERMFDQVDSRWLEHHGIVRQAFKGSLQYHGLFGEVVLRSPAVSSKIPYSLKDIFKFIVDTGKSNLGESSAAFDVDGESCRKYLGKVLNSETLDPAFKITRSANWEHQWPAWWSTEVCGALRRSGRGASSAGGCGEEEGGTHPR